MAYYLRRRQIRVDGEKAYYLYSGLSIAITLVSRRITEMLPVKRSTGEPISPHLAKLLNVRTPYRRSASLGLSGHGTDSLPFYGIELAAAFLVVVFIGLIIIQTFPISLALIGYGGKFQFCPSSLRILFVIFLQALLYPLHGDRAFSHSASV